MTFVNAYKASAGRAQLAGARHAAPLHPGKWSSRSYWRLEKSLFLVLGLFLGRGKPFQTLEELFLGHAVPNDLGIVGIDAAAGCTDERSSLRLGLVDLHVFLQRMNGSSLRSSGDMVVSAISRNATTGFLSLSRSSVI